MNTATGQRDHIIKISKSKNDLAYSKCKDIKDPWFRVQALSYVARFNDQKTIKYCNEATKLSAKCSDHYQICSVKSWIIAALAETGHTKEAKSLLKIAINESNEITPNSSKAEALVLLLQASFKIGIESTTQINQLVQNILSNDSHWRCKRAIKFSNELINKTHKPREFFNI